MKTHILIVEDRPLIGQMLIRYLNKRGYDTTLATSGAEAIRSFDACPADLLVTDVIMPEMDGVVLFETLRAKAPRLPAVFLSGNGGGARRVAPLLASEPKVRFLQKPARLSAILQGIHELLSPHNGEEGPNSQP